MVRADTPGAKKLVSIKDLTRYSAAPVLRAFITTENHKRMMRDKTPLRINNLKVKADMYRDIMAENDRAVTPLHTPRAPSLGRVARLSAAGWGTHVEVFKGEL